MQEMCFLKILWLLLGGLKLEEISNLLIGLLVGLSVELIIVWKSIQKTLILVFFKENVA
jgi:hypothetical protein